ncbi:ABC transporter substrate-binding protein [Bacillus horti]|uniref:Multiple sugar transport system substrate-binding protein n=1 Tax=Caldalkalibacillus horti TaxID=77523 RepID=A0ABT9VXU0_9BACI|nr:sugar ABC transporter substrate-binding protein [Bacillus horti]MDQ0165435.1 multiple sugar transport system substrate-binding protein [Bacillus horti]
MVKGMKFKGLILLVVLLIVSLAACSTDSSQPSDTNTDQEPTSSDNTGQEEATTQEDIEFRMLWWGNQDRHDRTLELIELYESQNPHVSIVPEFLGFGEYADRLNTQMAGGNAPDLFQVVDRWLPQYAENGQIMDLLPFIESGAFSTDQVDSSALDPGFYQGELVGINTGSNAFALAYNPDLFEEAGVPVLEPGYTWEDFYATARELSQKLGTYGTYTDVNHQRQFGHYLLQNDQWLYNDDGTALGWDDDQLFIDFFSNILELQSEGVLPPADIVESASTIENYLLVNNQAPMQIIHSNQIVAVANAANRDFELTILPSHSNGNSGAYVRASLLWSVNPNTEHADEIIKFIDWMTHDLEANDILMADRGVPISSAVREHLYDKLEKTVQQQFDYIDLLSQYTGESPPPPPAAGTELDQIYERNVYQMLYGQATPEEQVEKYKRDVLQVIE